jgi:hypothetical protein
MSQEPAAAGDVELLLVDLHLGQHSAVDLERETRRWVRVLAAQPRWSSEIRDTLDALGVIVPGSVGITRRAVAFFENEQYLRHFKWRGDRSDETDDMIAAVLVMAQEFAECDWYDCDLDHDPCYWIAWAMRRPGCMHSAGWRADAIPAASGAAWTRRTCRGSVTTPTESGMTRPRNWR